ncbi:PilZ domain-containing protein [Acidipila sp. EB88]|uniref:PilZ domain-containing protein n=1 Tax=Acidipila sp. EB88 TaxID=2305226 RepID=UPI0013151EE8|nr:PilZ domain-containing protein [Acidipila sp. EB88]
MSILQFFPVKASRAMVWEELRSAVRFPMHLPVVLVVEGEQIHAVTVNMSHNGVLLEAPHPIPAETGLEFLMEVPREVTLNDSTAAIHCVGHVIRSYQENGKCYIAAVIDDYRFQ